MLRWERTWSLRKIDASTDPNTEDSSVHEQHAQHAQPGRVIVGHCGAKQTVLLLADTSAAAETRIWTVEDLNDIDKPCYERSVIEPLKTKRTPPSKTNRRPLLKEIYQHHSNATIVHASVNTKHTLLAFTTFTSLSHPPLYETFLAEIQPQQRVFSLGSATAQRQRVHFIVDEDDDDDDDNDESQGNVVDQVESACDKRATSVDVTTSRLLFLLDRQYIQTYAIDVRRSSSSSSPGKVAVAYTIDGQPRKERTIARKHLWSTWDPYQSIVHVVRRREDLTAGSRMSTTSVSSLGSASSLTVSATPLDLVLTSVALLSPVDVSANVQAADVTSEGKAIPIPRTDSASSLDVGRAFGTAAVESPLSPGGSQSSILVNSSLWPSPARRRRRPVALGNSSAASDSTAGTHSSQSQTTDMPLPFDEDGLSSQLAALLTAELLPPCIDPLSHATFANAHSSMRVLHFDNNITCLILWWKGDQMQPVQFALWWWRKDEQTVVVRLQFDVAAEKFQDVLVGMASMDGNLLFVYVPNCTLHLISLCHNVQQPIVLCIDDISLTKFDLSASLVYIPFGDDSIWFYEQCTQTAYSVDLTASGIPFPTSATILVDQLHTLAINNDGITNAHLRLLQMMLVTNAHEQEFAPAVLKELVRRSECFSPVAGGLSGLLKEFIVVSTKHAIEDNVGTQNNPIDGDVFQMLPSTTTTLPEDVRLTSLASVHPLKRFNLDAVTGLLVNSTTTTAAGVSHTTLSIDDPWIQLMTAGHVPDHVISAIRNACKESSASSTQIPATKAKRFDGLLSRLFSSGANAASAAVATSSPTAADAGISSEDAMDVRQRKLFVKALADHIHEQLTIVAKGSTAMISEHSAQHGTPLFPATATPTLSSAFSFSSSWKSTSPLAEIRPHDPTADGLLRTRAHATAKEYARVMHATATMVCNVLNDERSVPRASDFTGQQQQQCECVNCRNSPTAPADASATPFPRTVSGSSVSAPQPLPPPSAQLPPAAAALFAQLHRKSNGTQQQRGPAMRSRFDYVSNVMRANLVGVAGGASDGGAASFVSPLSPLPKMNGGTGDVTVLAPRARHAADLSIHGMRSTYVLLHALALAMVELAVSAPVGFHTKFTTVGFHVLPRRIFLQHLDQGLFRMTDSFVKHALEVLDRQLATTVTTVTTDGDSVDNNNTATFRFQLLAHHSHLKKMLRAMRQSSVDDRLLSEFRIVEAVREQLLESRSHDGLVTNGGNRLSMAASMEALAQVVMGCAADSSNGNDGGAGMSAEGRGRARAIPLSVTRVSGASIATGATGGTTTSGDGSDEERGDDDDDDEDGTTTAEQRRHRGGSTSVNHPRTTMPMAINTTIAASRTAATQFGTPVPDPSLSETSFHRAMTGVNAHCDAHSHAVAAKETATSFLPARILAAHVRKKCTSTTTVSSVVSPLSPGSGDAATTGEELAGIVETWLNVSQLSVRPPNSG